MNVDDRYSHLCFFEKCCFFSLPILIGTRIYLFVISAVGGREVPATCDMAGVYLQLLILLCFSPEGIQELKLFSTEKTSAGVNMMCGVRYRQVSITTEVST